MIRYVDYDVGTLKTELHGDFEIYKGQMCWYGENQLLKKVMEYGKEEN